jgi:hypothetical protein
MINCCLIKSAVYFIYRGVDCLIRLIKNILKIPFTIAHFKPWAVL